jgi:hypothetical protein
MNPEEQGNINIEGEQPKQLKTKTTRKREEAKYNPNEVAVDCKVTSGKRFKSAPKPLIGYITGRENHDSMVKYWQRKPIISISAYNLRMSNIYNQISKLSSTSDIDKINHFNNYMRRVDVELVYEEDN